MSAAGVSLDPMLAAFGVPATITRPSPDQTPVVTTGFFIRPLHEEQDPIGVNRRRLDPRRIFVTKRTTALATMPTNTLIVAAEHEDNPRTWRVDGLEEVDADCWRVVVVPVS